MGIEPRRLQRVADSLPGMRPLDLRVAEGWCSPHPGRHVRRYLLAAAHESRMDPQEAGVVKLREGDEVFEGQPAG
jgi:hypothetical protein